MKTATQNKIRMTRLCSFLLTLALCIPMLFALGSPAAAADSEILFSVGTSACVGNLSNYCLPDHQTAVSAGQQLYINLAATEDIKLKTIEAYVSVNGGAYSLVGRETARNYLRWATFAYTPTAAGSFTVLVRVYFISGESDEGTATVSVDGGSASYEAPSGNSMSWNGIYYTVVPNASQSLYHYNQHDYARFVNRRGKNVGCTATAMATAYSILHNAATSPENVQWSSAGCSWELAARLSDNGRSYWPYTYTTQGALQAIYRSVGNCGTPVIVGVTGAGVDHVVTAIGFRADADPNSLSLSDILIIDPNGGQVCALDRYSGVDTGWSLRVPV